MSKAISTGLMLMVFVLSSCLFDKSGPGEDLLVDPNGVEPEESHAPWPFVADYQQSECYRYSVEKCWRGTGGCRSDLVRKPFCPTEDNECLMLSCETVESTYTDCVRCGADWPENPYLPPFNHAIPCFADRLEEALQESLSVQGFTPTLVLGIRVTCHECRFSGLCGLRLAPVSALAVDPRTGEARHSEELERWLGSLATDEPLIKVCDGFYEPGVFDPSMLISVDDEGMTLDMRNGKEEVFEDNRRLWKGFRIGVSSIFGSHAGRVIDTEGNERPVFFEFVPPQPRDGVFSTKLDGCPYCPAIDEVEIEDEMTPYHFGYFPIVMSETISSSEWWSHVEQGGGQSVLAEVGLHECDAAPVSEVHCWDRDHLATGLVCLDEPDETYAVLVGKWMAPFCEGFGLPRGILKHMVRLRDGAVRLVDWHPFTEEVWNNPWHMYPRDYAFEGTRIRVRGGVPSDCSGWLRNALEIELPSGEELVVDLPLRE